MSSITIYSCSTFIQKSKAHTKISFMKNNTLVNTALGACFNTHSQARGGPRDKFSVKSFWEKYFENRKSENNFWNNLRLFNFFLDLRCWVFFVNVMISFFVIGHQVAASVCESRSSGGCCGEKRVSANYFWCFERTMIMRGWWGVMVWFLMCMTYDDDRFWSCSGRVWDEMLVGEMMSEGFLSILFVLILTLAILLFFSLLSFRLLVNVFLALLSL